MIPPLLFVSALAFVVSVASAAASSSSCARELALTETKLVRTALRLQGTAHASQDEKCATYRTHVEVVTKARETFERCSTGRDREQDVGQMDSAITQVENVIANVCATQ